MTATAEPPEGSPADWYARGYRDGTIHASGQAVREAAALEARVRAFAAEVKLFAEEMQRRYGEIVKQEDRWQLHPAYLIGAEEFERLEASASGQPAMQQRWAAEAEASPEPAPAKAKRARRTKAAPVPEPQPALDWSGPSPTPPDPAAGESREKQMRRAAGRAWRA